MDKGQLQALKEVITKCGVNNYKEALKLIVNEIYESGCTISVVERPNTKYVSRERTGVSSVIMLAKNNLDCIYTIWDLLYGLGHHKNAPEQVSLSKDPHHKAERERFAWDYAQTRLADLVLAETTKDFIKYRQQKEKEFINSL